MCSPLPPLLGQLSVSLPRNVTRLLAAAGLALLAECPQKVQMLRVADSHPSVQDLWLHIVFIDQSFHSRHLGHTDLKKTPKQSRVHIRPLQTGICWQNNFDLRWKTSWSVFNSDWRRRWLTGKNLPWDQQKQCFPDWKLPWLGAADLGSSGWSLWWPVSRKLSNHMTTITWPQHDLLDLHRTDLSTQEHKVQDSGSHESDH